MYEEESNKTRKHSESTHRYPGCTILFMCRLNRKCGSEPGWDELIGRWNHTLQLMVAMISWEYFIPIQRYHGFTEGWIYHSLLWMNWATFLNESDSWPVTYCYCCGSTSQMSSMFCRIVDTVQLVLMPSTLVLIALYNFWGFDVRKGHAHKKFGNNRKAGTEKRLTLNVFRNVLPTFNGEWVNFVGGVVRKWFCKNIN